MHPVESLFVWLTAATVRGSLMALAILAIQAALRGRLPARWRYALWLPLAIVLAAPVLPQSRWSAESRLPLKIVRAVPHSAAVALPAAAASAESEPARADRAFRLPWRFAAAAIWLSGAAGLATCALASYLRTLGRMRRAEIPAEPALSAMIAEAAVEAGLRCPPGILVSREVQSPAVTGLFRPLLLVPAAFPVGFTAEEARMVLLHEMMHVKRWDLPVNWLAGALLAAHWFNPLLWFVFARMRADREAACDEQALSATGKDSRADYGGALLKLESATSPMGFSLGFVGIFENAAGVRARIRAIAAHRRAHPAWGAVATALIAALTLVGATRARSADAPAPQAAEVMIEAKILEVPVNGPLAITARTLTQAAGQLAWLMDEGQIEALMRDTEPSGAKVLARPKLVTLDGQRAEIFVGSEVQIPRADGGAPTQRKLGLTLTVTPKVGADGIDLSVKAVVAGAVNAATKKPVEGEVKDWSAVEIVENTMESVKRVGNGQTLLLTTDAALKLPTRQFVAVTTHVVKDVEKPATPSRPEPSNAETGAPERAKAAADMPIDMTGESTRFEQGVAIATGDAQFEHNGLKVQADALRYDTATKMLDAFGNVLVREGRNQTTAEHVLIDAVTGRVKTIGPSKTIIRKEPGEAPAK